MNLNKIKKLYSSVILAILKTLIITGSIYSWASDPAFNVYRIKSGDTLTNLARDYLDTNLSGYERSLNDYQKLLQTWNPHVRDWANLKPGTLIYLSRPIYSNLSGTVAPDLETMFYYSDDFFLGDEAKNKDHRLNVGAFYTVSQGTFHETFESGASQVDSTQTSPGTLGLMSQYKISGQVHLIAASLYWSKMTGSAVRGDFAGNIGKIDIPFEFGWNFYYQYQKPHTPYAWYSGIDFERFTTYNTNLLPQGDTLSTRSNTIYYGTGGIAYNFLFADYKCHFKAGLSKTIVSSSSTGNLGDKFEGWRGTLYLNIKGDSPFSVHILYKHHLLKGPTQLTVSRIGVGLGYFFY